MKGVETWLVRLWRFREAASWTAACAVAVCGALALAIPRVHAPIETSGSEQHDLGRFLERARETVPVGARVLVLTSILPLPDFDFWLGSVRPVRTLIELSEHRLRAVDPEPGGASLAFSEEALRATGSLLEPVALRAALANAEFVVITDPLRAEPDVDQALNSAEPAIEDGPRRLLRLPRR